MEEKLLFKNTSRMGKEEIDIFQNFAIKKTSMWTSIAILLICVGTGVGLFFVNMYLGIAMAVAGAIGAFIMPYVISQSVKKQNQAIFQDKKYLNHFEFFEDKVVITSEAAEMDSNTYKEVAKQDISYEQIDHVIVYGLYLFVFVNKYQSLILNQKGMTEGVVGELLDYFKSKGIKVQYKREYSQRKR